jgi:hypothetical protein
MDPRHEQTPDGILTEDPISSPVSALVSAPDEGMMPWQSSGTGHGGAWSALFYVDACRATGAASGLAGSASGARRTRDASEPNQRPAS